MKNHAICIPFPAQGHIRPMLKFAQLLHFKFGFHITFINTQHNHQTLFQSQKYYNSCNVDSQTTNPTPTFGFEFIPESINDPKDIMSVINHFILDGHIGPPLKELLLKLGSQDYYRSLPTKDSRPPVTCMISDVGMSRFTNDVAQEMGIPAVLMHTSGACGMMGYLQHRTLFDKDIIPLKDSRYLTNGYLDMVIDWIPSLKGIRLKDMPSSVRTTDPNDKMMNFFMMSKDENGTPNLQPIIVNTFDTLEQDVLNELSSSSSSNIYTIGPLNLLVDQILPNDDPNWPIGFGRSSFCNKEEIDYRQWLDSQEPNTVVFVNFGTILVLSKDKLVEFAWGLANSHHKFFWVVRSDLVIDGSIDSLPLEFKEEVKDRGLFASWCDQERVLAHPSIGGFVTHCGWNSTIESISNGVPMICCPFFAEQFTNGWYCCNYLGIGLSITSEDVTRNEIERLVKELMEGEKGKDMKKKAREWKKLAKDATIHPHGSSYVNLESIVNKVLLSEHAN